MNEKWLKYVKGFKGLPSSSGGLFLKKTSIFQIHEPLSYLCWSLTKLQNFVVLYCLKVFLIKTMVILPKNKNSLEKKATTKNSRKNGGSFLPNFSEVHVPLQHLKKSQVDSKASFQAPLKVIHSRSLTARRWKMMVGRLHSFGMAYFQGLC